MHNLQPAQIEEYLLSKNLRLRRRGNRVELETCIFCHGGDHNDKWKMVVYLDESGGNYSCSRGSCSAKGTFWALVEQLGDDPRDFYQRSASPSKTPAPKLKADTIFVKQDVDPQPLTATAVKYLKSRGFGRDVIEDSSIWCDEKGHICFGYYWKSELVFVKVRRAGPPLEGEGKAWAAWKGGLRTLWGLEQCDPTLGYLTICFGEYDCVALKQARIQNVVSVPSGDQDVNWIDICYDALQSYSEVILWPDNDESCRKAIPKLAERLGKEKVRVVKCEFKDPNDMLVQLTAETDAESAEQAMFEAVSDAPYYFQGDLVQLADIRNPEIIWDGYTSGIEPLDKVLGRFFMGGLTVHAGSMKSGKSSAVNQITAMAAEQGGTIVVWSGEDTAADYKYKLSVHLAGFVGTEIRTSERTGTEFAAVKDSYRERINDFVRDKIIVLDRRMGMNEDVLLENFELAFKRYGCDTLIVDNLLKLVQGKDSENENFRQSRIINMLSDFAKEHNVHCHVCVHTNKTHDNSAPPDMNSISGTKNIGNLSDRCLIWFRVRPEYQHEWGNNEAVVVIAADRVFGREVTIPIRYHVDVKRFGSSPAEIGYEYSL